MIVGEVMRRAVEVVEPEASAQDAAGLMGQIDGSSLPVGGSGKRLVGIVTDRDILYSRRVITCRTCRPSDTLNSAMDAMAANHIGRMPVQA